MYILTKNNIVFAIGTQIEKGIWENDPTTQTYRIQTANGYEYAIISDFRLYEVETVPLDFRKLKYCYTQEKGFYPNPDWKEPPKTEEKYTLDEAAAIIASEVSHG